ncbi:MAG: hypothetical protein ACE15C_00910 [Phycisphaerae bacterium]
MVRILIGIDDTDNHASRGTGYLARLVADECRRRGMRAMGVTRHQFLVDGRIPYTSHNSGACVAADGESGVESADFAFEFVAARAAEGSDPGVCVAQQESVGREIIAFGRAAGQRVLRTDEALALADRDRIKLRALGGTGQGVIGALAAVGLRAEGNDGRFIDLPGLRELGPRVDAAAITGLGIAIQHPPQGRCPKPGDAYHTLGWVRPRLVGGRPVLPVEWSEKGDAWVPVDKRAGRAR